VYTLACNNNFENLLKIQESPELLDEISETFTKIIIDQTIVFKNSPDIKKTWSLVPANRTLMDIFKNKYSLDRMDLTFEKYIRYPSRYEKKLEDDILPGFSLHHIKNISHSLDPASNIVEFFQDINQNRDKQLFIRALLNKINKNISSREWIYQRLIDSIDKSSILSTRESASIRHYHTVIQTQQINIEVDKDWAVCEAVAQLNTDVLNHLNMDELIAEQILKGNLQRK
jgi:hypothetical protein